MMTEQQMDDYFNKRFLDQVNWYSNKATYCKKRFMYSQYAMIIVSGILPVLFYMFRENGEMQWVFYTVLFLSPLTAIITGFQSFCKWQELWIEYRTTAETLKKEQHFYEGQIGDYNIDDEGQRKKAFIFRVENLISRQNQTWVAHYEKDNTQ